MDRSGAADHRVGICFVVRKRGDSKAHSSSQRGYSVATIRLKFAASARLSRMIPTVGADWNEEAE